MSSVWMIRAGRGGENVEEFLKHNIAAVGFNQVNLQQVTTDKEELLRIAIDNAPGEKEGSVASWVSQLLRLKNEVKTGDTAVTFDRDRRIYFLGQVTTDYEWTQQFISDKAHVRKVTWNRQVPRDALTAATRNTLGSTLTLFKINDDAARDLTANATEIGVAIPIVVQPSPTKAADMKSAEEIVADDTVERADEFIEDAINSLAWDEVQELVAGILRAMGYRTKVSPPGSDRGVDIFASPDGLGLQEPRIFVEVKHRLAAMSADKIRSFLGGRRVGDRCLYVSTGSFTREARYEAERASIPTTLIDLQELRRLLIENYEKLDAQTRRLVPLRRLYWPVR